MCFVFGFGCLVVGVSFVGLGWSVVVRFLLLAVSVGVIRGVSVERCDGLVLQFGEKVTHKEFLDYLLV